LAFPADNVRSNEVGIVYFPLTASNFATLSGVTAAGPVTNSCVAGWIA